MTPPSYRLPAALMVAAAVLVAAIFAFDLTPWVRGGFGWRWEYVPVGAGIIAFAALVAGYIMLAGWLMARRAGARVMLAVAFVAAALIPVAAVSLRGETLHVLFGRVFSEVASYHMVGAAQVDWAGGEWRDWPEVMGRVGSHVGTSPPGLLLGYGLTTDLIGRSGAALPLSRPLIEAVCADYRVYDLTLAEVASGWLGVLYPVWAALAVFPLYGLARRVGQPRPEAAALLWPLVPGLSGFAVSNSTVFPLLALTCLWFLVGGGRWRIVAAGVMFGLATFVNLALLPLAGLAGFYVLLRWWMSSPRPSFLQPVMTGVWFALGTLVPWAVWFALTGDTPLDIIAQSFSYHLELERPYAFWVWFHVWDWAVWGGLALTAAAIWWMVVRWRDPATPNESRVLAAALVLTVLALTLSGTTRGESGRIWLFLAPFVLVILAGIPGWRVVAGAQGVLTIALVFAVNAFNAPDVPPLPSLPPVGEQTAMATFTDPQGAAFRLVGYDAQPQGDRLDITLRFAGQQPPVEPVWLGVVLVAPDGSTSASEPQQPVSVATGERLPATCWRGGTLAEVRVSHPLPPDLLDGGYYVSLAAYGYREGAGALTVQTADGSDVQVGLGPFVLTEP